MVPDLSESWLWKISCSEEMTTNRFIFIPFLSLFLSLSLSLSRSLETSGEISHVIKGELKRQRECDRPFDIERCLWSIAIVIITPIRGEAQRLNSLWTGVVGVGVCACVTVREWPCACVCA